MISDTSPPIPADFPRARHPAAVSGFHQKLAVRLVEGRFVNGWTENELLERFNACADLVEQLIAYCRRKLLEAPGSTPASLLPRVRRGVQNKGWSLTDAEVDWIFERVSARVLDSSNAVGPADADSAL